MDPDLPKIERGRRRRKRTPPNPERLQKVDPSSQGPVDETQPDQAEGQEGVGPGPREAAGRAPRRKERGDEEEAA